ncbi:HotDog domain-containing protein [Aspergillus pseudotamarii]|uniref:HotDog domain-containing protein n=1 Tax=Aspergillus pseudotamarii TaxID=132259 RepID=A0A5N6T7Q1_ASPPS|nr:HotDog domain-containing protein [Aspergillus pseudotamarii]KAE8142290.1 HotDog domain-containing protein [Aspergillus pseudotamarii]
MSDRPSSKRHAFFEPNLEISPQDIEYFASLPFASSYLNSALYEPVPFITRYNTKGTSNKFFSKVINTADTIPHLLALVRVPDSKQNQIPNERDDARPDFVVFVSLGPDLCGFQDTAHGGVLAALLDEALGLCAEATELVSKGDTRLYTAGLEISYRSPVYAPSVAMIKTWVTKRQGRKWFLEAQVLDQDGVVKVEAKTLYISSRAAAAL